MEKQETQSHEIEIPIRFASVCRNYGPGMPDVDPEGVHEKPLRQSVKHMGLVAVHCWNLGEHDGPYPFEPGTRAIGDPCDWVPRAHQIVKDHIRPALDAARKAGVTVFHLATGTYAPRYPSFEEISNDPALKPPQVNGGDGNFKKCVRPAGKELYLDLVGPHFPGAPWKTMPEKFDIATLVRPLGFEPVVVDGWQLNGLCRRKDIDTLFYMGFMANNCLTSVPGAMSEMSEKFEYRCVVLREGTTAHEFADTHEGQWMTKTAIRIVESRFGYSASAKDFIHALEKVS